HTRSYGDWSSDVCSSDLLLPVLGGSGVLVDLESAVRGAGTGGADGTAQVWLSAAAPPSIVDRLRAAGLMVLGEDSVTGRQDRLDRQSTAATQRFQLLTAALGLLLAAAAVWVAAAVERGPRAGELVDLRAQVLPGRWAAALTLVLLALFATAAAVAGPAYLGAVDRSVVRQEVTAAAPNERSLSATTAFYLLAGGAPNIDLTGLASSLVALPGV